MSYEPERHHRRSIRLKGYDYTQAAAYFVTLCTHQRLCLFGNVVEGEMRLNDLGKVAEQCWLDIPIHYPHVRIDVFVIMPNHVHGLLMISDVRADDDSFQHTSTSSGIVGANNYSPLQTPQHAGHSPEQIVGMGGDAPQQTHGRIPIVGANNYSPLQTPQHAGHSPEQIVGMGGDAPQQTHGRIPIVGANNYSPLQPHGPIPTVGVNDISPQQTPRSAPQQPHEPIATVGANNYSPPDPPQPTPRNPPPHTPGNPPLQKPMARGTSKTVGSVVRGFKIGVTQRARREAALGTIWQRNYYEHIVRDEVALCRIRQYILDNPAQWMVDRENPCA